MYVLRASGKKYLSDIDIVNWWMFGSEEWASKKNAELFSTVRA